MLHICLLGAALTAALAPTEPVFIEGYTDPMSVRPGEEVRFHVSTNAERYSLDVVRVGAANEVVFTKEDLPGKEYPAGDESGRPGSAAMYGCRWPVALALKVPENWRSGYYHVVLRHKGQESTPVPKEEFTLELVTRQPTRPVMFFTVRAAQPGQESKILLQLTSNTYHAYNQWGGSSLYSGPDRPRVSFNRPIAVTPWAGLCTWELPFLRWAERAGYRVDVCCNLDLDLHPDMLAGYRLVLSVGHDEYWSAGMRDNLEAFIAKGGNAAFFSGNTCCWQVRVEDNGRALVCYKRFVERDPVFKTGDLRQLTTLWSDPRLKRPENLLTGVGFAYGGYNGIFGSYDQGPGEGEYTVHRPGHWVFAGTGLKKGQTFGKQASIAGYESDGCEYVLKDGLPVPTGRDGTPKNLEILATAPGRWGNFDGSLGWATEIRKALAPGPNLPENYLHRDGGAVLGVYTRGGTVVTVGSCDWAQGLAAKDPIVQRITRNILDRLSKLEGAEPLPTADNFPPKSPQDSLAAVVPRPGLKVELVAAEPLVMDPVDIAWGPDGKLWVVEMADYPLGLDDQGKPGGRVRWLEDANGDGVYDRSTLFLDNLNFPNGAMPWRKGVIVTCAPEAFYAEDTDGDGKADLRRPLFWGFGEGNQQHRVNHPRWGLDNWVYLANGDGGAGANGVIKSVLKSGVQLDIRGRDLRIRPDDGDLDTVTGQAQYGRNRDDWGNWFGCNNTVQAWFYAVDDYYVRRNPHVAAPPGRVDLTPDRTAFPLGWVVTHHALGQPCPPLGQPGAWTSLSGVAIYRDELLGPEYLGNAFFADAVYNAVSRLVVNSRGVLFYGERAPGEQRSEFLCSKDPWFRPATIHTGPDGALWVVDMYRFVIEHPEWINDDLEQTLELRLGHDKGRIYRILPVDKRPRPIPRLDKLDTAGLVTALDSPNGWQRDTAQQMLLWRADKAAVKPLEEMARSHPRALARLHALCTLDGLNALSEGVLLRALADEHPGVRRHAVRLSERLVASSSALGDALLKRVSDADPQVEMQLAYSLGEWKDARAGRALGKLAVRHAADPYLTAAVMSSAMPHVEQMIAEAKADPRPLAGDQNSPRPLEGEGQGVRAKLLAQLTKLHADIKAAPNVVAELSTKRRLPVQQLADKVLGGQRSRDEIHKALQRCKPALTLSGDAIRGQKTFVEATCSTCHRLGDLGTEIGPDLTTLVDRSPQNLIVAVVDPNRAVVAKYLEHVALTSDGLTYRGMLLEETSNQVTLVDVAGKSQVLLRKDLEELVCTGRSHMPEKLEEKLDQQQLADLFAFIRTMKPTVRTIVAHRPEVVAPEADNSLRLLAHQAEIHGARISYDAKQGCLVWHAGAPNDYVAWSADVAKPGVYEVSLVTAQIPEYADNPFSIEAGASRVVGRLPSTGGWGRWLRNDFGQLVLAAGRQRIVLRPDGPIKGELSDIRELRLAPIVRQ